jgi:hypothetical protein
LISNRTGGLTAKEKFWNYFQNSEKTENCPWAKTSLHADPHMGRPACHSLGMARLDWPTFLALRSSLELPAMA